MTPVLLSDSPGVAVASSAALEKVGGWDPLRSTWFYAAITSLAGGRAREHEGSVLLPKD